MGHFFLLIAGGLFLYGINSQKRDNQKMLDFSLIIRNSVLQIQKLEENLSLCVEEAESKEPENWEKEEERNFEEAELVEMIANPLLLEWTRLEAFQWIYENPEDCYSYVHTDGCKNDDEEGYARLVTRVGIPFEYFFGDLHRLNALDRTYAEGVSQELFDFIQGSRDIGICII